MQARINPTKLRPTAANRSLLTELSGGLVASHRSYLLDEDSQLNSTPLHCRPKSCGRPWTTDHGGLTTYGMAIAYSAGRIYISARDRLVTNLQVFNARTGRLRFSLDYGLSDPDGEIESVAIVGKVVIASTASGRLLGWPRNGCGSRTCEPIWQVDPGPYGYDSTQFVAAGDELFTSSHYVYDLARNRRSPYRRPAAPKDIHVTSVQTGNENYCRPTIVWPRPARTGGLPIKGSLITAISSDGHRITFEGGPRGDNGRDLMPGSYRFIARVQTAWGTSAASAVSASTSITADCHRGT